jgi:hypothetical protein
MVGVLVNTVVIRKEVRHKTILKLNAGISGNCFLRKKVLHGH